MTAGWRIRAEGIDSERAGYWETVLTIGNGAIGTRGALEEGSRGELRGTYLAGVFDGHESAVANLVNAPDWLHVRVLVDGWLLSVDDCEVLSHVRELDLATGVLHRSAELRTPAGARVRYDSSRFASMAQRDLVGLRVEVTPLDGPARIVVEHGVDADVRNLDQQPLGIARSATTRWDGWSRCTHVRVTGVRDLGDAVVLEAATVESGASLEYAAACDASILPLRRTAQLGASAAFERLEVDVAKDELVQLDALRVIRTGRLGAAAPSDAIERLRTARSRGFDALVADSEEVWRTLWRDSDVVIDGDDEATLALRFAIYHLLIAADPDDPSVSIGAKSMSGEGYRGHVFWDTEIMLLPFYTLTQPRASRALLGYRHRTLDAARALAVATGGAGARYPWESAGTGDEECPEWTVDGKDRFWTRDEEVHVSADVAFGIASYVAATGDESILDEFGAEIVLETARYWASRVVRDGDGFRLLQVMGPDEFHWHVDDNAFTNEIVRWHLEFAVRLAATHGERLGVTADESTTWRAIADGLVRAREREGVIEQFAGYFELEDVPIVEWDENDMPQYPAGRGHFTCDDTMLLKQPDVLMLAYLLPDALSEASLRTNFDFYEARTLHKSSLGPSVHAMLASRLGLDELAMRYFRRTAFVDLDDNQGNTADGMHIASAAGTWQAVVHGFAGIRIDDGVLVCEPRLPSSWHGIRCAVEVRGARIEIEAKGDEVTCTLDAGHDGSIEARAWGSSVVLEPGSAAVLAR